MTYSQISLFSENQIEFTLYETDREGNYIKDKDILRSSHYLFTKEQLIKIVKNSISISELNPYGYVVIFEADKCYEIFVRFGNERVHKSKNVYDHIEKYFDKYSYVYQRPKAIKGFKVRIAKDFREIGR